MDYESPWIGGRDDEHASDVTGRRASGPDLHGVRGWLLVLCLYLMIAIPLIAILGSIGLWQRAARAPELQGALFSEGALDIALAAFAAYAGWALYRSATQSGKDRQGIFYYHVGAEHLWFGPARGLGLCHLPDTGRDAS